LKIPFENIADPGRESSLFIQLFAKTLAMALVEKKKLRDHEK